MILLRKLLAAAALVALAIGGTPAAAQTLVTGQSVTQRNVLDNPAFNFYQRGTTAVTGIGSLTTVTYHADRWAGYALSASASETLTNITSSLPSTSFTNAEEVQRASSNTITTPVCLAQEIQSQDLQPLAGQQVTLSAWMIAGGNFSAANNIVTMGVATGQSPDQGLATFVSPGWGGAASSTAAQAITSSWQRYAQVLTVPASLIAPSGLEAAVTFCFTPTGTAGTNDWFQITGVQLEQGNSVSLFDQRQVAVELPRLQRYYSCPIQETSGTALAFFGVGIQQSTTAADIFVPLPQTMRVAPSFSSSAVGSLELLSGATGTSITSMATPKAASAGMMVQVSVASGLSAGGTASALASGGALGTGKYCVSADF